MIGEGHEVVSLARKVLVEVEMTGNGMKLIDLAKQVSNKQNVIEDILELLRLVDEFLKKEDAIFNTQHCCDLLEEISTAERFYMCMTHDGVSDCRETTTRDLFKITAAEYFPLGNAAKHPKRRYETEWRSTGFYQRGWYPREWSGVSTNEKYSDDRSKTLRKVAELTSKGKKVTNMEHRSEMSAIELMFCRIQDWLQLAGDMSKQSDDLLNTVSDKYGWSKRAKMISNKKYLIDNLSRWFRESNIVSYNCHLLKKILKCLPSTRVCYDEKSLTKDLLRKTISLASIIANIGGSTVDNLEWPQYANCVKLMTCDTYSFIEYVLFSRNAEVISDEAVFLEMIQACFSAFRLAKTISDKIDILKKIGDAGRSEDMILDEGHTSDDLQEWKRTARTQLSLYEFFISETRDQSRKPTPLIYKKDNFDDNARELERLVEEWNQMVVPHFRCMTETFTRDTGSRKNDETPIIKVVHEWTTLARQITENEYPGKPIKRMSEIAKQISDSKRAETIRWFGLKDAICDKKHTVSCLQEWIHLANEFCEQASTGIKEGSLPSPITLNEAQSNENKQQWLSLAKFISDKETPIKDATLELFSSAHQINSKKDFTISDLKHMAGCLQEWTRLASEFSEQASPEMKEWPISLPSISNEAQSNENVQKWSILANFISNKGTLIDDAVLELFSLAKQISSNTDYLRNVYKSLLQLKEEVRDQNSFTSDLKEWSQLANEAQNIQTEDEVNKNQKSITRQYIDRNPGWFDKVKEFLTNYLNGLKSDQELKDFINYEKLEDDYVHFKENIVVWCKKFQGLDAKKSMKINKKLIDGRS